MRAELAEWGVAQPAVWEMLSGLLSSLLGPQTHRRAAVRKVGALLIPSLLLLMGMLRSRVGRFYPGSHRSAAVETRTDVIFLDFSAFIARALWALVV